MYLVLGLGLAQLGAVVVQLATAKRLDLTAALWSGLAAQVGLGLLANVTWVSSNLQLAARTSGAEQGELFANIAAVALFGAAGTFISAVLGCVGNGVAHTLVDNLRRS